MERTDRRVCANCEAAIARDGRRVCHACATYRARNKRDRPDELVAAFGKRVVDKALARSVQISRVG